MRLRKERRKAGLTQVQLADAAGLAQSTVCDIERGAAVRSSFDTLDRLAKALNKRGRNVTPADLAPCRQPLLVKGARSLPHRGKRKRVA